MTISDKVSMFYNAKPQIFEKAKILRNNMTVAEQVLWEALRNKQMLKYRFRPQHPIDIFIVDFYCHALKLVVEVDGGLHKGTDQHEYDLGREDELSNWGIKVICFTNNQVLNDISFVIKEIECCCLLRQEELKSPL